MALAEKEKNICYISNNTEYEKENIVPCSKKIKLFDQLEKLFLSPDKNDDGFSDKDKSNEWTQFGIIKNNSKVTDQTNTKSKTLELTNPSPDYNNSYTIKTEESESDRYGDEISKEDEQLDDKENSLHGGEDNVKNDENIEHQGDKDSNSEPGKITTQDKITEEIPHEENKLGVNLKVEAKEHSDKTDFSGDNIHRRRRVATKRNYRIEDEDSDEEQDTEYSEESDYEDELKDDGEKESDNSEDDKEQKEEEDEKNQVMAPERKRCKFLLMSQMSNILSVASTKLSKVAEKIEEAKPRRVLANPRKRRRESMDASTRAPIEDLTPVRRSSRQVERMYYAEGIHDPELMHLLTKLENYFRLNAEFKPSLDETRYEEDFRGFKIDENKRNMYLERARKRRYRRPQRRIHRSVPVPALDVSEVTDDVLKNVATFVSAKVYSQNGSTCHQCRQKTTDTKTFCRSGDCTGVRGQFCGVCLLNRYGEDIVKALLDEKWACPPCRNICNCSICRNRKGLAPTGILTPLALHKGYESVKDYLQEEEKDLDLNECE